MLLLGVLAAQAEAVAGSYDLLETEILTGTAATVTFSSLSSTYGSDYQHLQLRFTARDNFAALTNTMIIDINSAGSGNFSNHQLLGNGSSVASYANTSSVLRVSEIPENSQSANIFGAGVIDILDAFDTSKYTTVRSLAGHAGSSPRIGLYSGAYLSTNAVDSITFDATSTSTFNVGSRFSIYGLKVA